MPLCEVAIACVYIPGMRLKPKGKNRKLEAESEGLPI